MAKLQLDSFGLITESLYNRGMNNSMQFNMGMVVVVVEFNCLKLIILRVRLLAGSLDNVFRMCNT